MKRCKCRGDTGNCAIKVCYKALPSFREVAAKLRQSYDTAIHVTTTTKNGVVQKKSGQKRDLSRSLIYTDQSVDKCAMTGLYENRECSLDRSSENSCHSVCCRGRFKERTIKVLNSCNCKFKFCCEVVCDQCYDEKTIFVCSDNN